MQAPQPAGPSRRAVGLPSNPRQGRVLAEASQQVLAPAPVQQISSLGSGRSTPSGQRHPPRAAASPALRAPASRVPLPRTPRSVKTSPLPRDQLESKDGSPSGSFSSSAYNEPSPPSTSSTSSKGTATRVAQHDQFITKDEPTAASADYQGLTAPIWSTVASVANIASNLTINVRIPWSPDSTEDGEQTPVGTESRLTRAMKSYHLSKAQTHRDLPDWLFTDKERRSQPASAAARNSQSSDEGQATTTYQPRVKAVERSQGNREGGFSARPAPSGRSLGSERLKALRERRRFEAGM